MTKEEDRERLFKRGHVCPDRKLHDNVAFDTEVSYSFASAIGTNTYVKCLRCGTQQDVTAYGDW